MTIANGPIDPKEAVSAIRSGDTVSQNFSVENQVELAARGCLLERCLTTPWSGLALWADRLLDTGFDEGDVQQMIFGQSRRLAGAT